MGAWGSGNFDNDAAVDFINEQIDQYVGVIEAILGDEERFRLDEDAEGMLMPCVELLTLLCEQCHGTLPERLEIAMWKSRYLAMFDDQIDWLEPKEGYKRQRQDVIEATFDRLLLTYQKQWRRDEE